MTWTLGLVLSRMRLLFETSIMMETTRYTPDFPKVSESTACSNNPTHVHMTEKFFWIDTRDMMFEGENLWPNVSADMLHPKFWGLFI